MNYISIRSVGPAKPAPSPQHNPTYSLLTPARALAPFLQKEIVPAASAANAWNVDVHKTWGILVLEVDTLTATNSSNDQFSTTVQ